ncbi:MAG TPA: hypothetical protein VLG09_02670 [Candidatus Saccharimonadales bacterium]|nr:hypothetical protein [Candidatus Saccharimonadales bacterium]
MPDIAVDNAPALFRHMRSFYRALVEEAEPEEDGSLVYRGHTTSIRDELRMGNPVYSKVMDRLKKMQCISVLKRGARHTNSVIVLHSEPSFRVYETFDFGEINNIENLKTQVAILQAQVNDLRNNVGGINIAQELIKLGEYVQSLEEKIKSADL